MIFPILKLKLSVWIFSYQICLRLLEFGLFTILVILIFVLIFETLLLVPSEGILFLVTISKPFILYGDVIRYFVVVVIYMILFVPIVPVFLITVVLLMLAGRGLRILPLIYHFAILDLIWTLLWSVLSDSHIATMFLFWSLWIMKFFPEIFNSPVLILFLLTFLFVLSIWIKRTGLLTLF